MAPEYEKLFDLYKNGSRNDVVIARLEAGANEDIAQRYEIFHFPMVVMFTPKSKEIVSVFKGKRIATEISAWIEQLAPQHAETKPEEDEEDYFLVGDDEFLNTFNKTEFHNEMETVKKEIQGLHEKIGKLEKEIKSLKALPVTKTDKIVVSKTDHNNINDNNSTAQTVNEDMKSVLLHNLRMPTAFELLVGLGGFLTLVAIIMTFRKLFSQTTPYLDSSHHAKI